jgi:hypothetical protein
LTWLVKGDHNTKFFHAQASERKKRNTVKMLKDGGEAAGKLLKTFIANQYQQLFMTIAGTNAEEVLDCV